VRVATLLYVLNQERRIVLWKALQSTVRLCPRYTRVKFLTLSYAPFSTYMTFSMPFALPISSATDFIPLPAMNAVIEPPSFVPAVTAANEAC
jgi:hypothetical protein